eukprot:5082380-Prymnesium_polylepis.1
MKRECRRSGRCPGTQRRKNGSAGSSRIPCRDCTGSPTSPSHYKAHRRACRCIFSQTRHHAQLSRRWCWMPFCATLWATLRAECSKMENSDQLPAEAVDA